MMVSVFLLWVIAGISFIFATGGSIPTLKDSGSRICVAALIAIGLVYFGAVL